MTRRGRKSWSSPEEEEFLTSRLPAYIKCQPTKTYENFWAETCRQFLEKWPERTRQRTEDETCIPAEGDLTEAQIVALKNAIQKRKTVSHVNRLKIHDN
jgi:hypothetical protein